MELIDYINNQKITHLIFAKKINAKATHLSNWINDKRPVPLHFALAIEKVTNGMVSVNELPLSNSAKKTLEQINNNV